MIGGEQVNINEEIKALAARYADCGITEAIIQNMMEKNPGELDERAKLIGLRLALGMEFNRQEYFSLSDIAHISGQTPEEALKMMRDTGATPVTVSIAPWLTGGEPLQ